MGGADKVGIPDRHRGTVVGCSACQHGSRRLWRKHVALPIHPQYANSCSRMLGLTSGVNSGLTANFCSFLSKASLSLSLSNLSSFSMKLASPSCFLASSQVGVFWRTVITPESVSSTRAGGFAYACKRRVYLSSADAAQPSSATPGFAIHNVQLQGYAQLLTVDVSISSA